MGLVCSGWVGASLSQLSAHMGWAGWACPGLTGSPCRQPADVVYIKQLPGSSPSHSCQAGKAIGSSSLKMSWQPKAGERCLGESSAGTRRDTAQALLSIMPQVSSQVELAETSQSKIILSPQPQCSSQAERWLTVTEGTITINCGSYHCEGVNSLFGLQLRTQTFLLNITK